MNLLWDLGQIIAFLSFNLPICQMVKWFLLILLLGKVLWDLKVTICNLLFSFKVLKCCDKRLFPPFMPFCIQFSFGTRSVSIRTHKDLFALYFWTVAAAEFSSEHLFLCDLQPSFRDCRWVQISFSRASRIVAFFPLPTETPTPLKFARCGWGWEELEWVQSHMEAVYIKSQDRLY